MKIQLLSEHFQNEISKSLKEAKLIPLTQIHDRPLSRLDTSRVSSFCFGLPEPMIYQSKGEHEIRY
jgi:hypothetical protein